MGAVLGPVEGVFRLVLLVLLAVKAWAFADATVRPAAVWRAVDAGRTVWLAILAAAVLTGLVSSIGLFGLAGLVAALVYLLDQRPKLRAVSGGRRPR